MNTLVTILAVLNLSVCGSVKTGTLLGLHAGGGADGLYEIDIDSGDVTLLHAFDFNRSEGALAVGPDGTLYAAFSGEFDSLMIINPETGDVRPVGPFGFDDVSGLAFAPDGTLYGLDSTTDQLIMIDPLTGEGRAIGFVASVGNGGFAFTPDGILHLAGGAGGLARLYTDDLARWLGMLPLDQRTLPSTPIRPLESSPWASRD
ncbi:MAG: hypothetical protein IH988_09185 [Planctomycetes bacterium]|nr:hypothetical protein [Planctomycetota bacterium]